MVKRLKKKTLGIIGGLGPASTVYFYDLLTKMSGAVTDQEHVEAVIVSRPSTPDRTAYILGKSSDSPVPSMIDAGRMLAGLGVDYIAIPCITAHCFYDELAGGIGVPIINMIQETALRLKRQGVQIAGLLGTEGTIASAVFHRALAEHGIRSIAPSPQKQACLTELIFGEIKANRPPDIEKLLTVSDELRTGGADAIVLACTELSLLRRDFSQIDHCVDALEILAEKSLELCGE